MYLPEKSCTSCGRPLRGRTDKRFCDDGCRSLFHNRIRAEESIHVRSVNALLSRNRRILLALLPPGRAKVRLSGDRLTHLGFCPHFFTHVQKARAGSTWRCCYEFAFRSDGSGGWLVRRKTDLPSAAHPALRPMSAKKP